jgi:hypothetical protein
VGIDNDHRMWLLGEGGDVLTEVKQGRNVTHNEAHADHEYLHGETVGEALLRANVDDVRMILSIRTGYKIRDHYSVGGNAVALYVLADGWTLRGWVEAQKERARAALAEEVVAAAVDVATDDRATQ